jgi:hypothetical protein
LTEDKVGSRAEIKTKGRARWDGGMEGADPGDNVGDSAEIKTEGRTGRGQGGGP